MPTITIPRRKIIPEISQLFIPLLEVAQPSKSHALMLMEGDNHLRQTPRTTESDKDVRHENYMINTIRISGNSRNISLKICWNWERKCFSNEIFHVFRSLAAHRLWMTLQIIAPSHHQKEPHQHHILLYNFQTIFLLSCYFVLCHCWLAVSQPGDISSPHIVSITMY